MPVCTFHSEYTLNKSTQTQMRYHFKREREREIPPDRQMEKDMKKEEKRKIIIKGIVMQKTFIQLCYTGFSSFKMR